VYPKQLGDIYGRDTVCHQETRLRSLRYPFLNRCKAQNCFKRRPVLGRKVERYRREPAVEAARPWCRIDHEPAKYLQNQCRSNF
jgi:hypothetical protein